MKINILILLIVLFSTSAFAGKPDNDVCSVYSGKAFGICTSAMNKGCGTDNEKNAQACDNMENHFIDATGEMPPWLITCPCWSEENTDDLHPTISGGSFQCFAPLSPGGFISWGFHEDGPVSHPYTVRLSADIDIPTNNHFCFFIDQCADGDCSGNFNYIQWLSIEEHAACVVEVAALTLDRNASCVVTP